MKMEMRMELQMYQEEPDDTVLELSPYLDNEVPTVPVPITRSDCIAEAHDRGRLGSYEAEGYWLLMASNAGAE